MVNSIRINSSGDDVRRTASPLPSADLFTMCAWFRVHSDQVDNNRNLLSVENAVTNAAGYRYLRWRWTNAFELAHSEGEGTLTAPSASGQWFFAFLRKNSTTLAAGWRALGGSSWTSREDAVNDPWTTARVTWGTDSWNEWQGVDIAFPRLWDAYLSNDELLREMHSARPVRQHGLNVAGIDDYRDYSGNERHFSLNGVGVGLSPPIQPVSDIWMPTRLTIVAATAFEILSITPNLIYNGLTGVVVTGTNFGEIQGLLTLDGVEQTITNWSNTSITFNVTFPSGWASPRTIEVKKEI